MQKNAEAETQKKLDYPLRDWNLLHTTDGLFPDFIVSE